MIESATTIAELFPAFSRELEEMLDNMGRSDLVEKIPDLPIVARCKCAQNNCAHFYTAPPPAGQYPSGHFNILLPAKKGLIVLDLIDNDVVAIEVLDRADVKIILDAFMPIQ